MTLTRLPEAYREQMIRLLGEPEAADFFRSYGEPRSFGLRLNPLKANFAAEPLRKLRETFRLEPVPWCPTGYYYEEDARPGKHPYHAAGLYYIQEPSAMSAAELLAPRPGETVLDLAAAPGGKTTQIAGGLNGAGLLVANEIHPARARTLSENVERMGIAGCLVTCAAPHELAARFPAAFDRVMLDAPCSGEGMFRKDPDAIGEWSPKHVAMCAARQADILDQAAALVKDGGLLVYSTCTFNRSENEEALAAFVDRHRTFAIERVERIWPHRARGEGHFVAALRKRGGAPAPEARDSRGRKRRAGGRAAHAADAALAADMALFRAFAAEALPGFAGLGPGEPVRFGERLFWLPAGGGLSADDLHGLRVVRPGLRLGDVRKGRFEPAHALAMHAHASQAAWARSYAADAPETAAWLRGETIDARPGDRGWGLVAVDGLPLGWGKASGGRINNRLPKGLRRP